MTTQLYRISFRTVAVKNQIINPTGPTTRWPSTIRSVVKKFYGLTGILLLPKFHFYPTHQKMSFSPKNLVDFRPFILIFVNKSFFIQNFNQLIQKTTQQMAPWNLKFKTNILKFWNFEKNFLAAIFKILFSELKTRDELGSVYHRRRRFIGTIR